ncbi:MAG: DUF1684 domain-containing protein [Acidobacteriota bacterium]|nr:DUF1684 domain-containing protein [Acidobacteriota bacterium]
MPFRRRRTVSIAHISLLAITLFSIASGFTAFAQSSHADWLRSLESWRAERAKQISAPDGWLSLAGLEWLKSGFNSIGADPGNSIQLHTTDAPPRLGLITVNGDIIQLLAPSGGFPAGLTTNGGPAREGKLDTSNEHPTVIALKGLELVVLKRGDRYILRIKDANSPERTSFTGLHWYAPDATYRVQARYIPYNPPQVEQIATVIGTTLNMTAPGAVEFMLKGKVYLLEPVFDGGDKNHFFFILRDETSQTTTYGGGRFLTTGLPDNGVSKPGHITIDFNKLYNPPCAYTQYATCPLPPEKNRLSVAIEAGEQRFKQ